MNDDEWWMPYVERLADLQITVGCKRDSLRFCPDETVTRARMASFLVLSASGLNNVAALSTGQDPGGGLHTCVMHNM